MTNKKEYPYTRSETLGTPYDSCNIDFEYEDEVWLDALSSTEELQILYDENGNPVSLYDCDFEWTNGRQLKSVTADSVPVISFTYDENGIRTSKTINSETTYYNIVGGTILAQSNSTETIIFQYNSFGKPFGFIYNGSQYYYITDNFGSILAVINSSGNILAAYSYDEWGKPIETNYTVSNNTTGGKAARANPLRYRGYYYDTETGYYYLQSRYYDPEIGRFINADTPEIAQQSKNEYAGLNLFAYCCNDPVNNCDPTGYEVKISEKTKKDIIDKYVVYIKKHEYSSVYKSSIKNSYSLTKTKNGIYELTATHYHSAKKFYMVVLIYGDKKAWNKEYQSWWKLEKTTKGFMDAMLELASVPPLFIRSVLNYGFAWAIKNKIIIPYKKDALAHYNVAKKNGYSCYINSISLTENGKSKIIY
jgi:RHS repeat-associated protein